jgi:hypothetical protein
MAQAFQVTLSGPNTAAYQATIAANLGKLPSRFMPVLWKFVAKWWGEVVMEQQFDREGAYLGAKWADLSEKYRNWKEARGYFTVIGKRSGDMWGGFTNYHKQPGYTKIIDGGFGVEMGAKVKDDRGVEYPEFFDAARKIFGDGSTMPPELLRQLEKITAAVYYLAMRTTTGQSQAYTRPDGQVVVGEVRFDGQVSASFLSEFPSGQIDRIIDEMIPDLTALMRVAA